MAPWAETVACPTPHLQLYIFQPPEVLLHLKCSITPPHGNDVV